MKKCTLRSSIDQIFTDKPTLDTLLRLLKQVDY